MGEENLKVGACGRAMLLAGEFFLGAVVAAALTKLVLRLRTLGLPQADLNRRTAEVCWARLADLTLSCMCMLQILSA